MTHWKPGGLMAVLAWSTILSPASAQLNREQIQIIRDTAASICDTVKEAKGQKSDLELRGDVNANLAGLIGKVVNIGGSGKGSLTREEFEGLSRDATATALEGDRGCRERVFNKMFDKLGEAPKPPNPSKSELILLNAVRASKRAPMSFPGIDDSLLKKPISPGHIDFFVAQGWPEELMELLFIASVKVKPEVHDRIERTATAKCTAPPDEPRTEQICAAIDQLKTERQLAGCDEQRGDRAFIFNSARNICSMAKFQTFLRTSRLLRIRALKREIFEYVPHTTLGLLYYLGELVAAQNYSERPYLPRILVGTSTAGNIVVPLFVVRKGVPPAGKAAVQVVDDQDEPFYVPPPEFGTPDEARSMQVLDFTSQIIPWPQPLAPAPAPRP